jgi:hypothetical protein
VKVLQLREASGDRGPLALHQQLTVVRGLDPTRRAWLIDALGRLGAGVAEEVAGELEAHGIRFPIDAASLGLLGLDHPVDAVVRAQDLPGHDPRIADAVATRDRALVRRRELTDQITRHREALAAAVAERDAASAALDEVRRGEGEARHALAAAEAAKARLQAELSSAQEERARHTEALNRAVHARDAAAEARAAAAERLERLREQRREAMGRASEAAARLEQARPVAADDPTDQLVARRAELAAAEAAAAAADPGHDSSPVARRLADLERRRIELVRMREAAGDVPADPVAVALQRLTEANADAPPVVAALALADTWRDLHQQIAALEAGVSDEEREAEERLALAHRTVIEGEAEFNQPVLTPEQIAKVEAAHAAVLEAQDRVDGRFGSSGRARKKLDEARQEERRVLERLGFSTYADYMMSSSSRTVGPGNRAALDVARTQLRQAEEHLHSLPGAADRNRRRGELLQRRDAVAPRVAALLGHEPTGPEAEDELRQLREPVPADAAALAALAQELEAVGIAVGPPPHEREDLVLLARVYLSEHRASAERVEEIDGALLALDADITAVRSAYERGQHDLPHLPPLPPLAEPVAAPGDDPVVDATAAVTLREARWAEVEAARERVAEAEAAVARHRAATDQLVVLEAELTRLGIEEEQAAAAVASAEAELAAANGPAFDAAVAAAAEAEAALVRSSVREDEAREALAQAASGAGLGRIVELATERLAAADRAVAEAAAAEQATAGDLAQVDATHASAVAAEQAALAEADSVDRAKLVDDVEWALMGRLARLRSVGLAGSVPLVLDDPFGVLDDHELGRVLDRVASLAGAVQVVLVSDREAAVAWAAQAGSERALVA